MPLHGFAVGFTTRLVIAESVLDEKMEEDSIRRKAFVLGVLFPKNLWLFPLSKVPDCPFFQGMKLQDQLEKRERKFLEGREEVSLFAEIPKVWEGKFLEVLAEEQLHDLLSEISWQAYIGEVIRNELKTGLPLQMLEIRHRRMENYFSALPSEHLQSAADRGKGYQGIPAPIVQKFVKLIPKYRECKLVNGYINQLVK